MQAYFEALMAQLSAALAPQEGFTCWLSGEDSCFVRFNHGLIRQPGEVRQARLAFSLIGASSADGTLHASAGFDLCHDLAQDSAQLQQALQDLRAQMQELPPDPHFLTATEVHSSTHCGDNQLPDSAAMVDDILDLAQGLDFVGVLAYGAMYRGFANHFGQRNWHQGHSFNLDFSVYQNTDKAVKSSYAGNQWQRAALAAKLEDVRSQLEILKLPPVSLQPGQYRVYLTPTALQEIISMLSWDGVGEKALRTKQSCLRKMRDEGLRLHPSIQLSENTAGGLAPAFSDEGFIKPDSVQLIQDGALVGSLIAPRTAQEYGLATNGADGGEGMSAAHMAGGALAQEAILQALGTGVYISNLWYLNFSDRAHCRMTGMTRFASFWVENGKIKAPLAVMRFDDSLFDILGDKLEALTAQTELLIDNETYEERGDSCARLPGALIRDFNFVL
ncbi:metallopeptidase TldD-related protein [Massilia sp. W12]|uniref:metallopeptidase TldD-related protein n=1 Tax=Massilia sp. W12 TaxID=3126507 RepID=UPI0030CEA651